MTHSTSPSTAFKDSTGRSWALDLNVQAITRTRNLAGVDLCDKEPGAMLVKISEDPVLFGNVLFAIVFPQAQAAGVSDEQFGEALGGVALEQAFRAFQEAWVGFSRSPAERTLRRKLAESGERVAKKAEQTLQTKLSGAEMERMENEAVEKMGEQIGRGLASLAGSGERSTDAPAS